MCLVSSTGNATSRSSTKNYIIRHQLIPGCRVCWPSPPEYPATNIYLFFGIPALCSNHPQSLTSQKHKNIWLFNINFGRRRWHVKSSEIQSGNRNFNLEVKVLVCEWLPTLELVCSSFLRYTHAKKSIARDMTFPSLSRLRLNLFVLRFKPWIFQHIVRGRIIIDIIIEINIDTSAIAQSWLEPAC